MSIMQHKPSLTLKVMSLVNAWLGAASEVCVCFYSEGMRAGTVVVTPRGTPHSVQCHARGSAGSGPGTSTAAC